MNWKIFIILMLSCLKCYYCNKNKNREERALLFPPASTVGILAAIAVPLSDLKRVFLSYNFEANYNSPFQASEYIPGPLTRLDLVRSFPEQENEAVKAKTKRGLVTRSNFYQIFERKLSASGFNGRVCLQKMICEATNELFGLENGVVGDVLHIFFVPSTSEDEQIHNDFNFAEQNGANGLCEHYSADCPQTVFDFITVFESS